MEIKDGILIIDVDENKIVQEIKFNGIKKNEIINLLKDNISTKEKNPFFWPRFGALIWP